MSGGQFIVICCILGIVCGILWGIGDLLRDIHRTLRALKR